MTHCGGNIVSYDVACPWQNTALLYCSTSEMQGHIVRRSGNWGGKRAMGGRGEERDFLPLVFPLPFLSTGVSLPVPVTLPPADQPLGKDKKCDLTGRETSRMKKGWPVPRGPKVGFPCQHQINEPVYAHESFHWLVQVEEGFALV